MSAHRFHSDWSQSTPQLIDPGNAKALPNSQCGHIDLVTTAAETRTLAAPTKAGLDLSLNFFTDGGDCVITVATAYNAAGSTTITLADAGDWVKLESRAYGTVFRWVLAGFDGVALAAMDITALSINGTAVDATALELNRAADMSSRVITIGSGDSATLSITEAAHDGRTIYLTKTDGWNATLPVPAAGMKYRIVIGATITVASTIKSVAGTHIMIGHALLGNDSDNTTVLWQAVAGSTLDTIDLLGTSNSTGGIAGQVITIEGMSSTVWYVEIIGDAAGTEATPFANTVA